MAVTESGGGKPLVQYRTKDSANPCAFSDGATATASWDTMRHRGISGSMLSENTAGGVSSASDNTKSARLLADSNRAWASADTARLRAWPGRHRMLEGRSILVKANSTGSPRTDMRNRAPRIPRPSGSSMKRRKPATPEGSSSPKSRNGIGKAEVLKPGDERGGVQIHRQAHLTHLWWRSPGRPKQGVPALYLPRT